MKWFSVITMIEVKKEKSQNDEVLDRQILLRDICPYSKNMTLDNVRVLTKKEKELLKGCPNEQKI